MARSRQSRSWMKKHIADTYVRRAQQQGYRSRASFKLLEIHEKSRLFHPGMTVVDLGAAPGGWSQVAARLVQPGGHVYALDRLPMETIENVTFIQGDFTEADTLNELMGMLGDSHVDLVMSDMAPNISGMRSVDQPRAMLLAELAQELALQVLKPGGDLLVKVFHGAGFDDYVRELRKSFHSVVIRKPGASKKHSREVYVLARSRIM
jgi:23S rRNA (uridine2552-2'-O)-methyltransferase